LKIVRSGGKRKIYQNRLRCLQNRRDDIRGLTAARVISSQAEQVRISKGCRQNALNDKFGAEIGSDSTHTQLPQISIIDEARLAGSEARSRRQLKGLVGSEVLGNEEICASTRNKSEKGEIDTSLRVKSERLTRRDSDIFEDENDGLRGRVG